MIVRWGVAVLACLCCALAQAQKPCPPAVIAEHMLGLFDSADPGRRATSVRRLIACKPPGLAGALRSVFVTDTDDAVRVAAVAGLADLEASDAIPAIERVAQGRAQALAVRVAALRALRRLGKPWSAQTTLMDVASPPAVRAEALRLLEAASPIDRLALEALARNPEPVLRSAAEEVLAARVAAAAAAAPPPQPEPPAPPPAPPPLPAPVPAPVPAPIPAPPPAPPPAPIPVPIPAPPPAPPPEAPAPPPPVVTAPPPAPAPPLLTAPEPAPAPTPPPPPGPPPPPPQPLDGSWLAVTSSSLFGSGLMLQLSLIGEQDSTGVLALTGSAGAVIGGGTAWGISRFYRRPTVGRALWYTNTGAWGVAAGLTIASSTGTDSTRWKLGGSVIGETAGLALGAWSAHRWPWRPGQVLLANTLALNAVLIGSGFQLARGRDPLAPDPIGGALVVPVLAGAAVASRYLDPSARDLHVLGAGATGAGWTGALLGAGLSGEGLESRPAAGGMMLGVGAGFLATAVATPFIDPAPRHTWAVASGLLVGQALGGGAALAIDPDRDAGFELGAGLGGVGLGVTTAALWPRLRFGRSLVDLTIAGAAWGAWHGTALTVAATEDGTFGGADGRRVGGGALAGTVAGGLSGAVLSRWLDPGPADHATALGGAALGASMGSGLGDLAGGDRGNTAGLVSGSAAGLALGATTAHLTRLRAPDFAAGALGIGLGGLVGGLGATLGDEDVSDTSERTIHGGLRLGAGAGGLAATATSRLLDASGAEVGVVSVASIYGAGIGLGAGLAWRGESLRPARVGLVAGPPALAGLSMALEPKLRLARGLGPTAPRLALGAAPLGALYGLLTSAASEAEDPEATVGGADSRRLAGGALWGASAASLSGLLLSRRLDPGPADWATAYGGAAFGGALGAGLPRLATGEPGRADTVGLLGGSLGGLALGTATAHVTRLRAPDVAAGSFGLAMGGLVGGFAATLDEQDAGLTERRTIAGGVLTGVGAGALGAATAAHLTGASGAEVAVPSIAALYGTGIGLGVGLAWRGESSRPARIGLVAGGPGMAGLALALEPALQFHRGLGPSAFGLGVSGAALGGALGVLTSAATEEDFADATVMGASGRRLGGGALWGASSGSVAGLLLSRRFSPGEAEYATAYAAAILGGSVGAGLPRLASENRGRFDTSGTLAGSGGGLLLGMATAHWTRLRPPDVLAGGMGLTFGGLVGGFAGTLGEPDVHDAPEHRVVGGVLFGAGAGALGAATAAHLAGATAAQVAVPSIAALYGTGIGLGAGLAWRGESDRPARIGLVAGPPATAALALVLDPTLKLQRGFPPRAAGLSLSSASFGAAFGTLTSAATERLDEESVVQHADGRRLGGGALWGASAGSATGLILSRRFAPGPADYGTAYAGAVLGGALGAGLPRLSVDQAGRADTLGLLGGSMGGLALGVATAHSTRLRPPDVIAGSVGLSFGGLVGGFAGTLDEQDVRDVRERPVVGGVLVGAGAGALGAATAAHLAGTTAAQVAVPSIAALYGTGIGLGAGLAWRGESDRPARIGLVAGPPATAALALVLDPWLNLHRGLPRPAAGLGLSGAALGTLYGTLAAAAAEPEGRDATLGEAPVRRLGGGALAGASAGSATGLLLSFALAPDGLDHGTMWASVGLGTALGWGVPRLTHDGPGRADTLGTLGGSVGGLALGATTAHFTKLRAPDVGAAAAGAAWGTLLGGLAPTLADSDVGETPDRRIAGGAMLGLGAGAIGATALSHATGAEGRHVGLAALGGLDGMALGAGIGLQSDDWGRGARIGAVAGAGAGIAVGATVWPRLRLSRDDRALLALTGGAGSFFGAWLPTTVESDVSETPRRRIAGGLLAGSAGGLLGGTLVAPLVEVPMDASMNAAGLGLILGGAGAGAGAMASEDDGVAVTAMLGSAGAGLLAGGLLHESIELDPDIAPTLGLGTLWGGWVGAWLPQMTLHDDATDVTRRERVGGLAAGTLGGAAVAASLPRSWRLSSREALFSASTATLASGIAGGLALIDRDQHDRAGVGILVGAGSAGLISGAALAPRLRLGDHAAAAAGLGLVLGASEGLAFAWAAGADDPKEWAGATLIGAGSGVTLGLAASAVPAFTVERAPAGAGFGAWGAWSGAWVGALFSTDARIVAGSSILGANALFAGGYLSLSGGLIEPRDFGWISLGGAAGTLIGAGIGAPLSNRADRDPIYAGLGMGSLAGLLGGAIAVRTLDFGPWSSPATAWNAPPGAREASRRARRSSRRLSIAGEEEGLGKMNAFDVAAWVPFFGALPPGDGTEVSSYTVGVNGLWW